MKLAWELKQKQLKELSNILTHENYTETGLTSGNDSVAEVCKGLEEYIDKANKTTWDEEKPEMDKEFEEVELSQDKLDTEPCPCEWKKWEEWSECSTSCGVGSQTRKREVEKNATNNGTPCIGPAEETQDCAGDPCRKFECFNKKYFSINFNLYHRFSYRLCLG